MSLSDLTFIADRLLKDRRSGEEFVLMIVKQLCQQVERYFWAGGHGVRRNEQADAERRRLLEAPKPAMAVQCRRNCGCI